MPLSANEVKRFTNSSGKVVKIVPLRSCSATRETVSTDTNQKSIKKTTTVLTSRQAGQRIVNKNTQTTTTVTNTQGAVVTEQSKRVRHRIGDSSSVFDARNNIELDYNKVYQSMSRPSSSRGKENKHKLSDKDKQNQELENIGQRRLVGNLTEKFELRQNTPSCNGRGEKDEPKKTSLKNKVTQETHYKTIPSFDIISRQSQKPTFHQIKLPNKPENIYTDAAQERSRFGCSDLQPSPNQTNKTTAMVNKTQEQWSTIDNNNNKDDTFASLSDQAYTKTFTFSIPRSSLYQVSSKELKSILDSSANMAAESSPSDITRNLFSMTKAPPDFKRGNAEDHREPPKSTPSHPTHATNNGDSFSPRTVSTSLHCQSDPRLSAATKSVIPPVTRGLDYSKIWNSTLRQVDIKPRRQINCYKDYLQ